MYYGSLKFLHHVDVVDGSLWPNTIVSQTLWKSSQIYEI